MQPQPHKQNEAPHSLPVLTVSRYWRAAKAARVLEAWRRSGQSGAAFAREHGVCVRRLLRWRDRLEQSNAPVFHPVRVIERATPLAETVTALELELRGGRRIRVVRGFDPELLEA